MSNFVPKLILTIAIEMAIMPKAGKSVAYGVRPISIQAKY